MSTSEKIIDFLTKSNESRLADIVEAIGASRQMVHRAIKLLLEKGLVQKIGTAPKTFYKLKEPSIEGTHHLSQDEQEFLEEHFLIVTEIGTRLTGTAAMSHWSKRQNLPFDKTVQEFIRTRKKYLAYFQSNGLIDGSKKIKSTKGFEKIGLSKVYYLDFYAIERFGKTRLGTLLHLAKQGQNKKLMYEIIRLTKDRIFKLITHDNIDAVGFIPPTIKREVQFMKVLERQLNLSLPHISLVKVKGTSKNSYFKKKLYLG